MSRELTKRTKIICQNHSQRHTPFLPIPADITIPRYHNNVTMFKAILLLLSRIVTASRSIRKFSCQNTLFCQQPLRDVPFYENDFIAGVKWTLCVESGESNRFVTWLNLGWWSFRWTYLGKWVCGPCDINYWYRFRFMEFGIGLGFNF